MIDSQVAVASQPQAEKPPLTGAYWVQPGDLLAGPYPGAWNTSLTRDRLLRLLQAGITSMIDLTASGEAEPYAWLLPNAEVHYQRLPIHDMSVPDEATMRAILDAIDAARGASRPVYVHCLAGLGRTGTVIGCYLVRHGLSGEDALRQIATLRDGRTGSPETAAQIKLVRHWREAGPQGQTTS